MLSTIAAGQTGAGTALDVTNGFALAFHVAAAIALAGAGIAGFLAPRAGGARGNPIFPRPEEGEHEALAA